MLIFEVTAHFTQRYLPRLEPSAGHFNLMVLQFCLAGTLTIAVTHLSRKYFQDPFLRMKGRLEDQRDTKTRETNLTNIESYQTVAS